MKLFPTSLQDLSIVILALILIAFMFNSVSQSSDPEFEFLIEIEVKKGDTLWAIANDYGEGKSIQSFLTLLRNHNGLDHDRIYPGQKLIVPQQSNKRVVINESDHLLSSKY